MIFASLAILVLLFGIVLPFGAPYLPTRRRQIEAALDLLDLKKGQVLYELGCGDGRVLKQAAKRGVKGVGYEMNPLLVAVARFNTFRCRKNVKIIWGDFWRADLGRADGVFVFLLDRFMKKLDSKMKKEASEKTKLVSYAFKVPGKKAAKYKNGLYLYKY